MEGRWKLRDRAREQTLLVSLSSMLRLLMSLRLGCPSGSPSRSPPPLLPIAADLTDAAASLTRFRQIVQSLHSASSAHLRGYGLPAIMRRNVAASDGRAAMGGIEERSRAARMVRRREEL